MRLPRIALIEDHPDNRLLVVSLFEDDYDFIEFETGGGVAEQMKSDPPDLILMDISLPELDGYGVLQEVKAEPLLACIPVIAMTAHAMDGDRQRCIAAGFDAYVSKPIGDGEVLLNCIRQQLTGRGSR